MFSETETIKFSFNLPQDGSAAAVPITAPAQLSHICGTCEHNETFPDDFDCIKALVFTRAGAKTEQLDDLDMKFKLYPTHEL